MCLRAFEDDLSQTENPLLVDLADAGNSEVRRPAAVVASQAADEAFLVQYASKPNVRNPKEHEKPRPKSQTCLLD